MTATIFTYRAGAELPNLTLPWQEEVSPGDTWTNLDLSSGYTFTLTLVDSSGTTQLTKTTNITGADGSVTVDWANDDLDLSTGIYTMYLRANENGTSHDRDYRPANPIQIRIV